jgi:hypothetical protein
VSIGGHDLRAPDDAVLGTGRYRVIGKLGQCGMGAVYIVADRVSGQAIALERLALSVDETNPTVALQPSNLGGATLKGLPDPIVREGDSDETAHAAPAWPRSRLAIDSPRSRWRRSSASSRRSVIRTSSASSTTASTTPASRS